MAYLDYALIEKSTLGDIGDAIREKTGGISLIDPANFASEIENIPSALDEIPLQEKIVTENGEVLPDEGYCGLNKVIVDVKSGDGSGDAIVERSITDYKSDTVSKIGDYVFYYDDILSAEAINATEIGNYSFGYCKNLKSINFPLVETLGTCAFLQCTSLEDVLMGKVKTISSSSFDGCTSLKNISLPLVEIVDQGAFQSCYSLESVNFPLLTQLKNSAFYYCSNIKNINFPLLDTLHSGGYHFACMDNLQSLSLPSLKKIDYVYNLTYNDKNLSEINLQSLEEISSSNNLITYGNNIYNISLPNIKSITFSYNLFSGSNLRRMDLGHIEKIQSQGSETSKNIFSGSSTTLLSLILRKESVLNMSNEFNVLCWTLDGTPKSNLIFIYVPNSVINDYKTTYSAYAHCFRAIEDYPEVCAVNWNTDLSPQVEYRLFKISHKMLVGISDNATNIPIEVAEYKIPNNWYFVGLCDSTDFVSEENVLTYYKPIHNCILYGLYKIDRKLVYYGTKYSVLDLKDIAFYYLSGYKQMEYPITVEPEVIQGWEFIGWGNSSTRNDFYNCIVSDDNGNVVICADANTQYNDTYGLFGVYKQNVTVKYMSSLDNSLISEETYVRYFLPYNYRYAHPSFTIMEAPSAPDGYTFTTWLLDGVQSGGTYLPGDTFSYSDLSSDMQTNTEYNFYALFSSV